VKNFTSISFLLRALQLVSIAVITRYTTVFSLTLMLWLFVSGLTFDPEIIHAISLYVGLPSSLLTFYFLYFYNIPENNFKNSITITSYFGGEVFENYWEEYLLTFSYIFLYSNFIRLLKKNMRRREMEMRKRRNALREPQKVQSSQSGFSLGKLIMAILLRNSYIASLFVLYWIGMQKVNIFNMILILFFIVFFIFPKYARKYWLGLVLYTNFMIFVRYVWVLGIFKTTSSTIGEILAFIGIVDRVHIVGSKEGNFAIIFFFK